MTTQAGGDCPKAGTLNIPIFILTGGFMVLFSGLALIDMELVDTLVSTAFAWSTTLFGAYWQVLLLATFGVGLFLAASRAGRVRLGGTATPEMSRFQWMAIIMCTLLAGGGVFWAAGEPMAHFTSPPPLFGVEGGTPEAVYPALAQSFMHWGFLAWAILGALTTLIYSHFHYEKGLPLAPRTLLYPLFGARALRGPIGMIADASCILAVVAGTIGPIGFLGLQVSYGLSDLFGITDGFTTQALVIAGLVALYTVSAVSGITRGIQILSRFNVILAVVLLAFILVAGPTAFIIDAFLQSTGIYIAKFLPMALFRADTGWLGWWTVFFWGWFLGYGPLMGIFIAKVSRGRSLRELIVGLSIVAPLVTFFWFSIIGGSGIAIELANPGAVSGPFEGFNLPAALLAITQQLPLGTVVSVLFLVLTTLFVATTGDSMTYTIALSMTDGEEPNGFMRVFWGIAMGITAVILIALGSGGISALQSFIVVTAVPVSLIMLPSLWDAPRLAFRLADAQDAERAAEAAEQALVKQAEGAR